MNDLLFTQGQDNLAGLVGEIYTCPSEDIATLPPLAVANSLKTTTAAITCKIGKKFQRTYMTDETGRINTKSVGERDGKGRESMLTYRYPKVTTEAEDNISDNQNTPSVVIFRVAATGKLYFIGVTRLDKTSTALSTAIPAYFEQADTDSGEKRPDQHGTLFGWKYTSAHGPIEYAGTIPLVAAE